MGSRITTYVTATDPYIMSFIVIVIFCFVFPIFTTCNQLCLTMIFHNVCYVGKRLIFIIISRSMFHSNVGFIVLNITSLFNIFVRHNYIIAGYSNFVK